MHWLIAALVLGQIAGGYVMTSVLAEGSALQFAAFQLHKSLGVTVLVLTVARISWRLFNPPPPEPESVTRWEARFANIVHKLFYVLLIAIPLAGWLVITVSRIEIDTVLFSADWLPWPHLPGFAGLSPETRHRIEEPAATVHAVLAYAMGVLVLLHVAGALKHQLADGGFLARMSLTAPGDGPRNSFGHATTWLVTMVFFVTIVGCAVYARRGPTVAEAAAPAALADATDGGVQDTGGTLRSEATPASAALPPIAADGRPAQPGAAPVQTAAATTAPSAASPAPSWRVVGTESALTFAFTYQGAPMTGTIAGFDAAIRFDPANLAGSSISADLDLGSATVAGTSIAASQVAGPDGLASASNPRARFEATAIRSDGAGYVADGRLALRGITVAVPLAFSVDIDGNRARAAGTAALKRLDYGVAAQSDPAGTTLSAEVTVNIAIVAERP